MPLGDKHMVDADFWANMAAEHIYSTAGRRVVSAETLRTIILWAFGFFSVGGFALNLFGTLKNFHQLSLVCFGICFLLLVLAYYFAGQAQFPASKTFKVGSTTEIADAFSNSAKKQTNIFQIATTLTGIGFFFLAVGLLIQFGNVKEVRKVAALPEQPIVKTVIKKRKDSLFVPVIIQWKKDEPVYLSIVKLEIIKAKTVNRTVETNLFDGLFYPDSLGRVFYSYSVLPKDSVKSMIVRTTVTKKTSDTLSERMVSIKLTIPSL